MDPLIGRVVDGYKIEAPLGEGGMASVYRASRGGEAYAIKFIHPALAKDRTARKRLEREAEVINQVQSAGVAAVYDVKIDSATPYVVMELIEGITIEKDVEENGPWSLEDLCDLAKWLFNILEELHASGVLHRDISPSNIMISQEGPVLIDFGLAQSLGQERFTSTGMVAGKPDYISPQLYRGEAPTPADDWWAWLGVLLFALTGKAPFGQGRVEAKMARIVQGEPVTDGLAENIAALFRAGFSYAVQARPHPQEIVGYLEQLRDQQIPDEFSYGTLTSYPQTSFPEAEEWNLAREGENSAAAGFSALVPRRDPENALNARAVFPAVYAPLPENYNYAAYESRLPLKEHTLEDAQASRLRLKGRKAAKSVKNKTPKTRRKVGRFAWFMVWVSVILLGGDWLLPQISLTHANYENLAFTWHSFTGPWIGATLIVLLLRIRYAN